MSLGFDLKIEEVITAKSWKGKMQHVLVSDKPLQACLSSYAKTLVFFAGSKAGIFKRQVIKFGGLNSLACQRDKHSVYYHKLMYLNLHFSCTLWDIDSVPTRDLPAILILMNIFADSQAATIWLG